MKDPTSQDNFMMTYERSYISGWRGDHPPPPGLHSEPAKPRHDTDEQVILMIFMILMNRWYKYLFNRWNDYHRCAHNPFVYHDLYDLLWWFNTRGGDGSVVDQSRRSPLHYAVEKGLTRIVQVWQVVFWRRICYLFAPWRVTFWRQICHLLACYDKWHFDDEYATCLLADPFGERGDLHRGEGQKWSNGELIISIMVLMVMVVMVVMLVVVMAMIICLWWLSCIHVRTNLCSVFVKHFIIIIYLFICCTDHHQLLQVERIFLIWPI